MAQVVTKMPLGGGDKGKGKNRGDPKKGTHFPEFFFQVYENENQCKYS